MGDGSIYLRRSRHHAGREIYRASKSALNQLMRSYAARRDDPHAASYGARLGQDRARGPNARLTMWSIPSLVTTVDAQRGSAQFLDYLGQTVAW